MRPISGVLKTVEKSDISGRVDLGVVVVVDAVRVVVVGLDVVVVVIGGEVVR